MSKFKRYKCDKCLKEIDVDNDLTHAFIDRCELTSGCLGTLRFVNDKNTKDLILNFESFQQSSLIGKSKKASELPEYVDVSSSIKNEIILAVKNEIPISNTSILDISVSEILNKEQEFQEYVFNLSVPITAISGKDHSTSQRVLTFDPLDRIVMFINGQEIDSSLFSSESNIIRFTDQIIYSTYLTSSVFIKILVFSPVDKVEKTLSFKRNVNGLSQSAWGNFDLVQINNEQFSIFVCADLSNLELNTRLTPLKAMVDGTEIELNSIMILLAQFPFSSQDRIYSRVIPLDKLNSSVSHLKYHYSNKAYKALGTSMALADVFPLIRPISIFDVNKENELASSVSDDTSLNVNITEHNQFVIGPV